MAYIRFTLSKRQPVNGRAEILVRFSVGRGLDWNARTGVYVPVEKWDSKRESLVFSTRFVTPFVSEMIDAQNRLSDLRRFILSEHMANPDAAVSRDWLVSVIERFHNPSADVANVPLSDLVERYVNDTNIANATGRQYLVIAGMLRRYDATHEPMMSNTATTEQLSDFVHFIETENDGFNITRGRNTIASKLKKFRAVCNWAYNHGYMTARPFDGFAIPSEIYGTPIFLSLDERDRLASCDTLSDALSVQRDIFVFQCHIGCRVSDLYALTHDSIIRTADGVFVEYMPQKTIGSHPETIRVPLDAAAASIVAKYATTEPVRLLPFISVDKYNDAIKRCIEQSGVDRPVIVRNPKTGMAETRMLHETASSHLARRTFAANLFKLTKSERIVASMTGHAPNSRAFARYSTVDDEMKMSVIHSSENPNQIPTQHFVDSHQSANMDDGSHALEPAHTQTDENRENP